MLMIAQGTIHRPVTDGEAHAASAWLGPMMDSGFLHAGWIEASREHLWMVISASTLADARERLDDLPPARAHSVSFTVARVEALRIS